MLKKYLLKTSRVRISNRYPTERKSIVIEENQ